MKNIPKIMCSNISNLKLDGNDLFSNGVISKYFIKKDHKIVYDKLHNSGLIEDFELKNFPNIKLGVNEKNFIQSFMLDKDISIPSLNKDFYYALISLLRNL